MENQLHHLEEFREILKDYQVGDEGKQILAKTNLALLVAPSASGRNTIVAELLKTGKYHFIVSDTTRKPRKNNGVIEKNGVEYWFRQEDEVLHDLAEGKYLEAAVIHDQQVSGISLREISQALNEGKVALTDIETVGMNTIIAAKPDAHAIFVIPPSFTEWMKRMEGRGHMAVAEKRRRLMSAEREIKDALTYDYYTFVLNDSVAHAAEQIETIVFGKPDITLQARLHELATELLASTQHWLSSND